MAFGVKGAALVSFSRGILGAALAALTTLIGGEAAYGLWGELSYMFFDGAPLPAEARAIAYGAFWLVQTLVAGGRSAGCEGFEPRARRRARRRGVLLLVVERG